MKLLNYILLFATFGLFISCSTNDKEPDVKKTNTVTLSGTKSTDNLSLSADFKIGSKIGVYITTTLAPLQQSGNHVHNAPFTASESGFSGTNVIYPDGVPALDFYAYAPYTSTNISADKTIEFSVEADQTASDNSDLLWVKKESVASGSAPALVFDHMLSQIIIKLTPALGVTLDSPTVTVVGTLPTVNMNVEDGTLGKASGSAISIIPTVITNLEKHAIVVPQTLVLGSKFIIVNNGLRNFEYILDKNITLQSGKSLTFTITVKNNDIDVNFTGSLNEWDPASPESGDAI